MTDWKANSELIESLIEKRNQGKSFYWIAVELSKEYGLDITKDQAQKAFLRYGPDHEIESIQSGSFLIRTRDAQNKLLESNTKLKILANCALSQEQALKQITKAVQKIKPSKIKIKKKFKKSGQKLTCELLFSDWQIGKVSSTYNTEIAIARLKEYTASAILKIQQHLNSGYDVEKIVLVFLGDIIEGAAKAAQKNSPRSVDISTSEQLSLAIEHMYTGLIYPLTTLGLPLHVIGVTGNHDNDGPEIIYYNPGKEHLSWTIYKTLELIVKQTKLDVTFEIPTGYFCTYDYYGQTALYEHGYKISAREDQLVKRRAERMKQIGKYITYFRMGDKHNICRWSDDTLVVNGAFFGSDKDGSEYSSISGYGSVASQLVLFHTPRQDDRLTIYDTFSIQLNHIR